MYRKVLPPSEDVNPYKLKSEIEGVIADAFDFKTNAYYTSFTFKDISESTKLEEVSIFVKRITEITTETVTDTSIDDETGEETLVTSEIQHESYRWIEYDFQSVLNTIDEIISAHVPYDLEAELAGKIAELSAECGNVIRAGIEWEGSQYSAKDEDKIRMATLLQLASAGKPVSWHQDGCGCVRFEADVFVEFVDAIFTNETYHLTYMGEVKEALKASDDVSYIRNFKYGDALPEEFAVRVNELLSIYNDEQTT